MDDLKLLGKRESQVESLVNTVHTMNKDLEWSLVLKNAGVLGLERAKVVGCERHSCPAGK